MRLSKRWVAVIGIMILIAIIIVSVINRGGNTAKESLLWEIHYQDQQVGTLFGTIHLGTNTAKVPDRVAQSLAQSDILVTEVPVIYPSSQAKVRAEKQAMQIVFPATTIPLDQRVDRDTFERLKTYFEQRKIPAQIYNTLDTKVLLTLIMFDIPGLYSQYGMEVLLSRLVKDRDIENLALEGIAESLTIYNEALGDAATAMINFTLVELPQYQAMNLALYKAYSENNISALLEVVHQMDDAILSSPYYTAALTHFEEQLLEARNYNWVDMLIPLLKADKTEQYFIAVGALHLFGEEGLVELLTNAGFVLKAIDY